MLMVIPTNLEMAGDRLMVDGDFAEYLKLYLTAFDRVTVACTIAPPDTFPTLAPRSTIADGGRLKIIVLPEPYREDRYFRSRKKVHSLLEREIAGADFVVVTPHAAFDWPTMAAEICIRQGKPYNMESDWNLQQVNWSTWEKLPFGLHKLHLYLRMKYHDPRYLRAMRHSNLALLHGYDVFEAYRDIAPNPHMVNNFRVTPADRITPAALDAKLARLRRGAPLRIAFAARAIGMKGPFEWLQVLAALAARGIAFEATWFGDGELLPEMQAFIDAHGLADRIRLAGKVGREVVFDALFQADLFLFCHLTRESPRNLVEALTAGAPIIGFGSPYAEHLVADAGGGLFVETGDVPALTDTVAALERDREKLASLIEAAAASGRRFDRTTDVQHRIALMKEHLLLQN